MRAPATLGTVAKRMTTRISLSIAALIVGGLLVGTGAAGVAIISSYGGMFGSVRCFDPNVPACTGLYYYYGVPGILLLAAAVVGLVVIAAGIVVLGRSVQPRVNGHQAGL